MFTSPTSHDITRGHLLHNIAHLAWPIMLSQLLFILPHFYDTYWLGAGAQAAAGLATSVRMTMISV